MKRSAAFCIILILLIVLASCATTGVEETPQRFSLVQTKSTESSTGLLKGNVNYGASGFYFPTTSDILDISLLKTDSTTGLVTEISHQRLRNFQKFPIQFTVRYDNADLNEGDTCTLIVTLLMDDQIRGQGLVLLKRNSTGFEEAELTLLSV